MGILDSLNLTSPPNPATVPLHVISLDLGPEPAVLVERRRADDARYRAADAAARAREILDAADDDERAEIEVRYRAAAQDAARDEAWCGSAVARVGNALTGAPWDLTEPGARASTACPACQPYAAAPDGCFYREHRGAEYLAVDPAKRAPDPTAIRAACLRGCTPDAIAAALVAEVTEYERAEAEKLAGAEVGTLAAEMDLCAVAVAPQAWLIPSLVPARALTANIGRSGDGKSWLMLHQAICIAGGIPFLGQPVTRGRVLVGLLESFEISRRRIDALATGLGTSLAELRGWLDVWPRDLLLKSDDPSSMAELARRVTAREYVAIFLDNVTKLRTTRSQSAENDSSVMGAVFEPLAELAQNGVVNGVRVTADPPAIIALHHAGKDGSTRGSTGIDQNLDFSVEVRRKSQRDPESPLTIGTGDGSRIACEGLPIVLRYRGVAPSPVVPELVTTETIVVPRTGSRPKHGRILETLDAAPEGMGANALAAAVGGSKRDAQAARDELAAEGAIELRGSKWHRV